MNDGFAGLLEVAVLEDGDGRLVGTFLPVRDVVVRDDEATQVRSVMKARMARERRPACSIDGRAKDGHEQRSSFARGDSKNRVDHARARCLALASCYHHFTT